MSANVDVLARIEAVWGRDSDECDAVAELIEAASAGAPMKQDRGGIALYFTGPKAERLRAALARVSGEGA